MFAHEALLANNRNKVVNLPARDEVDADGVDVGRVGAGQVRSVGRFQFHGAEIDVLRQMSPIRGGKMPKNVAYVLNDRLSISLDAHGQRLNEIRSEIEGTLENSALLAGFLNSLK